MIAGILTKKLTILLTLTLFTNDPSMCTHKHLTGTGKKHIELYYIYLFNKLLYKNVYVHLMQ